MQVTSLNKVINLFLVGVPAALIYFFVIWQLSHVRAAISFCFHGMSELYTATKTENLAAVVQVTATMLFLGIGAFCGVLTQGIANIMKGWSEGLWKSQNCAYLLGAGKHRRHYEDYRRVLQARLKEDEKFGSSIGDLDAGKTSGVKERYAPKRALRSSFSGET